MMIMMKGGISGLLVFISIVSAAVLIPRDVASILAGLKTINSDVTNIITLLTDFYPDPRKCAPLVDAATRLNKDVNTLAATLEADPGPALSDLDSHNIINYINDPLIPNIKAAVKLLNQKKSLIESICRTKVQIQLNTLAQSFRRLTNALAIKIPGPRKAEFQQAANNIQAALSAS